MRTLVIQSYRSHDVPAWIARCLASVKAWAHARGFEHLMTDDRAFALCGPEYLAVAGDNKRSITNLARLELIRLAHREGYDRAIWMDADIFVFAPDQLTIDLTERYAFARETYIGKLGDNWAVDHSVNNSVIACMAGEPDLDLIIQITRHVARHHVITSNYQLGGDIVKGLRKILKFQELQHVGMFSPYRVSALAGGDETLLTVQARQHRTPVWAANLCAGAHYERTASEAEAMAAMDALESTRGAVLNDRLAPD
jgi:hypothetical protein